MRRAGIESGNLCSAHDDSRLNLFASCAEEIVVKLMHPLGAWIDRMSKLDATLTDDPSFDGETNLIVFPLPQRQRAWLSPEAMDQFFMEAFRCFSRKLAGTGRRGWFYAWYDEETGTVRCTATYEDTSGPPRSIPPARLVDEPSPVSRAALGAKALEEDGVVTPVEEPAKRAVFARPLIL
jgi:hypothetical protein